MQVDADLWGTAKFVDSVRLPYIAPSLGGVDSLIEQPTVISYWDQVCSPANLPHARRMLWLQALLTYLSTFASIVTCVQPADGHCSVCIFLVRPLEGACKDYGNCKCMAGVLIAVSCWAGAREEGRVWDQGQSD